MNRQRVTSLLAPVAVALVATVGLLALADAPPLQALGLIGEGAFAGRGRVADTLMAWAPVAIAGGGLIVTFAAGLWNIGVEGQMVTGAIAASAVARSLPGDRPLVITLTVLAGVVGGASWGLIAGLLKVKGRVNEIFAGIGLGFVAQAFATYLIIGPWQRAGVASTSGTEPFRQETWLPTVGGTRLAPIALTVAVLVLLGIRLVMRNTRFGLRLRAVGSNPASAALLGVPAGATTLRAFLVGGGLAGLAGALLVTGIQHKLVPAIGGGRGFLAVLVVLLAGSRVWVVGLIALFFAAISVGSSQLQLRLNLDSSLGSVIQGLLVLTAVLYGGWRARRERSAPAIAPAG
ncbi:MAG TPA: ABC transporter permease [Acidimicrobiia bacterium]|nr:ABC transporter permease [Acidimicrobiia bacterium]